jgi:tetratricopeptide (TPR) repeat protein
MLPGFADASLQSAGYRRPHLYEETGDDKYRIAFVQVILAKDPGYALAYSGLADAYSVLPTYGGTPSENIPKANTAARRALELDPTLAHPHAVLGSNEMEYDWDFAGGEAEYKKAFELDPNDATAHQWYAEDIGKIGGPGAGSPC